MRLKINQRNWLLSLHIATGGLWFGIALCSVALALSIVLLEPGEAIHGINLARNVLGQYIIIPAAVFSVITGILLCGFTNWGFFKHYWVMVKQLVTLLLIVLGSVWLGPMTKEMTALSEAGGSQVLQNPDYLTLQTTVTLVGALQTLALLIVIIVSTLKPWGKRKAVQSSTR
ncbi:hypothetical protein IQE94_17905 (plasmid) [Synechocystis sp. PCC 7339]|uniref:hypothetical protein n=1 Tax=unclassified Synechocystis TaxID=2640012 RepID=UPI001BB03B90|nr:MULTISPECIES: hypothetical protein [unclassified Synechocystis]QUS62525.1 hypothetical protein HTZ78_17525 [Synechocystis sp. PCC 7338]UAJ74663.1 hypothetical protein IQE94_17905 [Synechocystis sp. PCC 7339]